MFSPLGLVHDLMWVYENNVEDGLMNFVIKILMTIRRLENLKKTGVRELQKEQKPTRGYGHFYE